MLILVAVIIWQRASSPSQSQSEKQASNSALVSPTPAYLSSDQLPSLNLEQILSSTPVVELDRLDPKQLRTIVVTGDVIPARGVDAKIRQYGPDYPFVGPGISDILQSSDVTIVNLEAPLLNNCPVHNEGFTFCGQATFAQAMASAGVDVATLENNHVGNFGQAGITETIQHLVSANIDYATSSRLSITNIRGLKVGILAFTGVGGQFYPDSIRTQIGKAKPQVDLLLVAFHWGKEYELIPTADPNIAPDDPRDIARIAVQAGADMVIGNHPHWVQGVELINTKLVNYAYGNFIFDQSWSTETMQGYIGIYTFYGPKLVKVKMQPIEIRSQAQPNLPSADIAQKILDRVQQSSQILVNMSIK